MDIPTRKRYISLDSYNTETECLDKEENASSTQTRGKKPRKGASNSSARTDGNLTDTQQSKSRKQRTVKQLTIDTKTSQNDTIQINTMLQGCVICTKSCDSVKLIQCDS